MNNNTNTLHSPRTQGGMTDMTVGSPARGILRFAVPLVLGYILQQMYQVIDAVIVGRWIGVGALAAVGASSSIMFLIMGFCNGSCAGFAIPVAQAFGAKDFAKMRSYVSNAVRIGVVLAVVITLLSCAFCSKILHLVNTPSDIFDDAWTFLFLQFLAIPFTIAYNLQASLIRALGDSKHPFYFLIFSSLFNIALDAVLIFGLGMGVLGAGVATLLAQAFSSALCYGFIRRRMTVLIPQGDERAYDNKRISILLNNGVPMGLQFSITAVGVIMLQSANNALGTLYVASFTAAVRIKYLFTCVFENIGVAMATYCGQNYGAGKPERILQGVKVGIAMFLTYALFTWIVLWFGSELLALLFIDPHEHELIQLTAQFLHISSYFYPALGLLCLLRYSIQGVGFSNFALFSGVSEMIARVGVSLWIVPAFGFVGVCFGDPTAWLAACLFLVPAFIHVYRVISRRCSLNHLN